jgi:hypothetical protein
MKIFMVFLLVLTIIVSIFITLFCVGAEIWFYKDSGIGHMLITTFTNWDKYIERKISEPSFFVTFLQDIHYLPFVLSVILVFMDWIFLPTLINLFIVIVIVESIKEFYEYVIDLFAGI